MPRLIIPASDPIRDNVLLLRDYLALGEAFLGVHQRSSINGFKAKLRYLRNWAYNQMIDPNIEDGTGGRIYLVLQGVEIEYEQAPDGFDGARMVRVYWRPNRVMRERAAAGLPSTTLTPEEQEAVVEARVWLLEHL